MQNLSIKSPLDVDFYKFTMAYFVWKYFPDVHVKYEFKNRTKGVSLVHLEKTINYELFQIRRAYKYEEDELAYISSLNVFPEEFIRFLALVSLPKVEVKIENDELKISTEGLWKNTIWWETMVLSSVNCMFYKDMDFLTGKDHEVIGKEKLVEKIQRLKNYPQVRFSEFGTRRRFSFEWQKIVLETLQKELPEQLVGTSNVLLAKELGLKPIGTTAHELTMVGARLFGDSDDDIRSSHGKILDMWFDLLGEKFSIALTDTYGSKFFFEDFGEERAHKWIGLRQDSGSAKEFAKTQLNFYQKLNINTQEKSFIPSDGLKTDDVIGLTLDFGQDIKTVAGWGTELTNDCGYKPLSIVMKATEANGMGTVKLSDNLNKATGKPEDIERFKRIFGYENTSSQETIF